MFTLFNSRESQLSIFVCALIKNSPNIQASVPKCDSYLEP